MSDRIVAALAWFDEPTAFLDRLVRSLAALADELLVVDGRWRLHADGTPESSPRSQVDAIKRAADESGLRVMAVTVACPWTSQVAKRNWMMRFAGIHGDWVLVVDGDEYLEPSDPAGVRAELAATDRDVAEVTIRALNRPWPYEHLAPMTFRARRLYRSGTGVVGPAHNDYALGDARLNGDPVLHEVEPACDLSSLVTIAHDNRARGPVRNVAAERYRRARRAARVEVAA